jgi:hypothetical protein
MTTLFPDDRPDPTSKEPEDYPVHQTLGIIGHIRSATRKRHWRYIRTDSIASARAAFSVTEDTPISHHDGCYAVWMGPGTPPADDPAFEVETTGETPSEETSTWRLVARELKDAALRLGSRLLRDGGWKEKIVRAIQRNEP